MRADMNVFASLEPKAKIVKLVSLKNKFHVHRIYKFMLLDINECDSNPCSKYGTCVDGIGNYTCDCEPGFQGVNCDVRFSPNKLKEINSSISF